MVDVPAVLIGEAHVDAVTGFDLYFRSLGFDVDTAVTGRQVLQKVSLRRPDVLLLDMQLPDPDGWEVAATLRRTPASSDLPIVALAAQVLPDHRQRARALDVDGFFAKPSPPDDLLVEVSRILTGRFAGRRPTARADFAKSAEALQRLRAATASLLKTHERHTEEVAALRRRMVDDLGQLKGAATRKA